MDIVVADVAGRLSSAVDALVTLDADTLTATETGRLLEAIDRDRNRLDGARSNLAASFARRDGHRHTGHKSLAHWMQDRGADRAEAMATALADALAGELEGAG